MKSSTSLSIIPDLTEEQRERLLGMGALRWDEKQIAFVMGWREADLHRELLDENSEIFRLLQQGHLEAKLKMELALLRKAQTGEAESIHEWTELVRDRSFNLSKLDLFGGAEDEKIFSDIADYMKMGRSDQMSPKEQSYLEFLQIIYSFYTRNGKRSTVKILTAEPYNLKYSRAADLIDESLELFNAGRRVSKAAIRNHMADTFDSLYHAAVSVAKTTKDYEAASSILVQKAKVLALDKEDPPVLEPDTFDRRYRLLSLSPQAIGLPSANRDELAAQIDQLEDVTEAEKERLRMDAGIVDMDIFEILHTDGTQKKG